MKLLSSFALLALAAVFVACALAGPRSGQADNAGAAGGGAGADLGAVATGDPGLGSVGLNLTIAPGVDLFEIDYVLQGPRSYLGTAHIGDAQSVSVVVGGVQAGSGYTVTLSATDSAGDACSGQSAPFDVAAGAVTFVAVTLQCTVAGTVGIQLTLPPGTIIPVVNYTLSGPNSYSGSLVVGATMQVEFTVGDIQAGDGYTLTLTATDTDGDFCSGTSAPFDVVAGQTVAVGMAMTCTVVTDAGLAADVATGSAEVDAAVVLEAAAPTLCPGIASFSVNPAELLLGQASALSVAVVGGSAPPAIAWSASPATGGTFTDAAVSSPTFTCSAPGNVTVMVTVDAPGGGCAGLPFTSMSGQIRCEGGD